MLTLNFVQIENFRSIKSTRFAIEDFTPIVGYNNRIVFAHCKHGKKTKLGQAMKNLANVKSTPEEFAHKIKAAAVNKIWGSTNILRLRTPTKTWAAFETDLTQRVETPNFQREVHIVVTILSKADLTPKP